MSLLILNNVSDIRLRAVLHNTPTTTTGDYESIVVTLLDANGAEIMAIHLNPAYGKSEMKVDWESTTDMRRTKEEAEALAYDPPF